MKTFLKITAVVLVLITVILIGLNIYFTDERLKNTILPQVREATGSDIQVETMSFTFFRTFPRFGLGMSNVHVPDTSGQTIASVVEVLLSFEIFSLFRDEISIPNLSVRKPTIYYTVFEDSTTNIDFLIHNEDSPEDTSDGYNVTITGFELTDASVFYGDNTTNTHASMEDLDASISLRFSALVESDIRAELAALNFSTGGTTYIRDLSLSIDQTSTLDLDNEVFTFTEGTFSIRGLALNLTGSVSNWSSEAPEVSLNFNSSSDNFGELLRLAPPEYEEQLSGFETRGSLALEGNVNGAFTEESLPDFNITVEVNDGFLQDPDLPEAIQNINISATVNNELTTIEQFSAEAGENHLRGSGRIERPLEEDAAFTLDATGDINLATVSSFYPIDEAGIEQLSGQLNLDATANGQMDDFENTDFSGEFILADGRLKYAGVPNAIEEINARIDANQNRIQIAESGFTAATNRLTLSGTILNPLDESQRSVDVVSNINFDLATIKDFYPIDEDTLSMRGLLNAEVALRGKPDPDQIETVLQRGRIELTDGFLAHKSLTQPLEQIIFRAEASGPRLAISEARFMNGENSLSMRGSVTNYLSEQPTVDLTFDGNAVFSSINNYYSLEPWIRELTGDAVLNLNTKGPVGDAKDITLNGALEVNNVTAIGDSIPLPVTNLSGKMNVNPQQMTLERFTMNFGESDISLQGSMRNYMSLLEEEGSAAPLPIITGSYSSRFLNVDEMIDWDEEASEERYPIELPGMTANVDTKIDQLRFLGIPITQVSGRGQITPEKITVEQASAKLFDGTATGNMEWNVPAPLQTNIIFSGKLDSLKAETFFRDTGFLGPKSTIHRYVSGSFSSDIQYSAQLHPDLSPDITTATANGTFGMSKVRLQGHPIQAKIAEFLKTPELESLTLDQWTANFSIRDTVMTIQNLKLTSGNLGLDLEGTLHMQSDRINYKATLLLPEQFKKGIASVISERAADALQLEDGRMAIPVRITGTTASPRIGPDTETIDRIVRDYIRDGAKNVLRRLLDG